MYNFSNYDWLGLWKVTTTSDSEDWGGKLVAHMYDRSIAKDEFATLLFRWWAVGNVIEVVSNEDSLSEYLSIHPRLQYIIRNKLRYFLPGNSQTINDKFHAELPDNGYTTGYELLHGVNMTVGGFQMNGTHQKQRVGDYCVHNFDIKYTWNDIIDPNKKYSTDTAYSRLVSTITDTRDYNIHISWKKSTQIIERNGAIISASGYAIS